MKPSLLLIALLLLASPLACQAYSLYRNGDGATIRWDSDRSSISAYARSFSPGTLRAALADTVDSWNLNPSDFRFTLSFDDEEVSLENGQSEIWWTDIDIEEDTVAFTYVTYSGRDIEETDILFNSRQVQVLQWTIDTRKTDLWAYGGNFRPFQTALMHELGHALGLDHEDGQYNIMGTDYTHLNVNGGTAHFYPGEDACNGAVSLYGLHPANLQDVSVTHWKYSDTDGEYSTHERTVIKDLDGNRLRTVAGTSDDPIYRVNQGQEVKLEITFENSGASTQTPLVHFVLSRNDVITTGDTLLDTRHPIIGRNRVYRTTQTLTIPDDLVVGQTYYLGIIMDPDNTIAEVREDNNRTYVGIRVE